MKTLQKISALFFIGACTCAINAQSQKITVSEDAFIQGGETSGTAFGQSTPKNLRIFNSKSDNKYSRTTYLKFTLPKKIENLKAVELNINLKVYKSDEDPKAMFNLQIYAVENDTWNEATITWNDTLELGSLVGEIEVPQSLDDKNQNLKIKLNAEEISKLVDGKKDREITLALLNSNFNKIGGMAASKEQSDKNASFLLID
ncbi:DNRLRE domain-containing protein [Mariniflexile ostreae]|uniref:DNRLRE domain-containing protein n=1 Tax=Mariniflexile ostreae TaxID=1520892 RepID=A0ABV5FF65_9FLAO